ncbi:hypothetical protein [Halochromatium roseum]|uniref:hypothetical protein n=1 Tax=Halochromatium roseum TaxID=391920 RepID=UPI001914484D|nr:hypothetical protein [Halochromatium roseum]
MHRAAQNDARDLKMGEIILNALAQGRLARHELIEVGAVDRKGFFNIMVDLGIEFIARLFAGFVLSGKAEIDTNSNPKLRPLVFCVAAQAELVRKHEMGCRLLVALARC